MYDFYFGEAEEIEESPREWLLSIKRMLPRWPNGVPDSEFLALYDLLESIDFGSSGASLKNRVLVETGSGASTIVLLYFAVKWDIELYSWDICSTKLSYLRGMLNDTLFGYFRGKNLFNHWKYVSYSSISDHVGISILSELNKKILFSFFDSDHTWKTLKSELDASIPFMADKGIITIDDGYYEYEHTNTSYINMIRTKLGLNSLEIPDNKSQEFWKETEQLLNDRFDKVINLNGGTYRENYKTDIFWEYYNSDRKNMEKLKMEMADRLEHRFDAWQVYSNVDAAQGE